MLLFVCVLGGFWMGKHPAPHKKHPTLSHLHPEKDLPISEHKSFVVLIYAHNQADWCQRALRSVFEQQYDHYRVIVIDDASIDQTEEKAKEFIVDNHQDEKVILIRNETPLGELASLYRVIDSLLDREIALPLNAKDWLSSPLVLSRLNRVYQNPDVWLTFATAIEYPSYTFRQKEQISFYAALFKELRLTDLLTQGRFASNREAYLSPLIDLSGGRLRTLNEPLSFLNLAAPLSSAPIHKQPTPYTALATFPPAKAPARADVLIFSEDRPLQLYACLESIQRYVVGFDQAFVLYRASDPTFAASYELVKDAFPAIRFYLCGQDIKPFVEKTILPSASQYLLLGLDDWIAKDYIDLKLSMDELKKTGAYGFFYSLEKPPSGQLLGSGIYAYEMSEGPSLSLSLFKKANIPLASLKYKSADELALAWNKRGPKKLLGLYFDQPKSVHVPLTGLNEEELLVKFNQGLKIDLENGSADRPQFILR